MTSRQMSNLIVELEHKPRLLVLLDALREDGVWIAYLYDRTRDGIYRFSDYPTYRAHQLMVRTRRPHKTPSVTFDSPYAARDGGLSLAEVRAVMEDSLNAASWSLSAIHRISTPPDDARFVVRVSVTAWVDIVSYAAYLATIAPLDARGTGTPRAGMPDPRPITEREQS